MEDPALPDETPEDWQLPLGTVPYLGTSGEILIRTPYGDTISKDGIVEGAGAETEPEFPMRPPNPDHPDFLADTEAMEGAMRVLRERGDRA